MRMKMLMAVASVALTLHLAKPAAVADTVAPALVTVTNIREESIRAIFNDAFYRGTTLRFTNSVLYAGTSNSSPVQALAGAIVAVTVGQPNQPNTIYTARVDVAASGLWSLDITVPTNSGVQYMQTMVTDTNGTNYIYPWKTIPTKDPL